MIRVHVVCEGPTELTFVREVLQDSYPRLHLIPILPGKVFGRQAGGDIRFDRVKPDILRILKKDRQCFCTTFLDFYGLRDFPSMAESNHQVPRCQAQPHDRVGCIELAIADSVAKEMGPHFRRERFQPYLSIHEFEALLFSDPRRLSDGLYRADLEAELVAIRGAFETPEHIDDGRETAPSKRLKSVCGTYDKVTGGNLAALAVGLEAMRRECSHFRDWLAWLSRVQSSY